jgi:hypothetical protein
MGTADLTRYELSLGSRDETTGWRNKEYAETTIEGVIQPKGASFGSLGAGGYAVYDHTGFIPMTISEGDLLKDADNKYYMIKTCPEVWVTNKFIGYYPCDLAKLPNYPETSVSVPATDQDDTRHRTKGWIDAYLSLSLDWACIYAFPDYPLQLEFTGDNAEDVLYCVDNAKTTPLYHEDASIFGYVEKVPITIAVLQKYSQDDTQGVLWAAEDALRTVCKDHPLGSRRQLDMVEDTTVRLGSYNMVMRKFTLSYKRSSEYTPSYPRITWGPSAAPTGTYIFPNAYDFTPSLTTKDYWDNTPAMVGDSVQPLGSKALEVSFTCDLDIEPDALTWKRSQTGAKTDATKWDIFTDLWHNEGIDQAYHTLTLQSGGPSFSVRLFSAVPNYNGDKSQVRVTFREYRTTDASGLTYSQRLGIT